MRSTSAAASVNVIETLWILEGRRPLRMSESRRTSLLDIPANPVGMSTSHPARNRRGRTQPGLARMHITPHLAGVKRQKMAGNIPPSAWSVVESEVFSNDPSSLRARGDARRDRIRVSFSSRSRPSRAVGQRRAGPAGLARADAEGASSAVHRGLLPQGSLRCLLRTTLNPRLGITENVDA